MAQYPNITNYPSGFNNGVAIRNIPVLNVHGGRVFWVDYNTGADSGSSGGAGGGAGTFQRPFKTIDYAVGKCTANNGDIIMVYPGHTETIIAAGGLDLDVAGISIIGLGSGSDRPTINFTTATTADIDVDAANITLRNFLIDVTGVDAVVGALDVNAADFTLEGCEVLMADSGGQATEFIVTATAANRMRVINNVIRSPNAGANNAISIEGTPDGIEIIGNYIYGDFADAAIHNPTGNVATNVRIENNYLQNDQTGDHAIELVSAVTGVFRNNHLVTDAIATAADLGSLKSFDNWYYDASNTDVAATPYPEAITDGGHSLSQIADRLGADADTDAISAALYGPAGIATFPAGAAAANAVSMAEVLRYVQENIIVGSGTALPSNTSLFGILAGATGVTTYPAAAAPANGVSLAEVIRAIYDRLLGDGTDAAANAILGKRVNRSTADVLTGAAVPIFTVSVGRVLVTAIIGKVTTVIGAGANNSKFQFNPTTGTTNDICANLDIDADEAGTLYSVDGTPATAMLRSESGAVRNMQNHGIILDVGDIEWISAANVTGSISFQVWYIPLDDGALLAAA